MTALTDKEPETHGVDLLFQTYNVPMRSLFFTFQFSCRASFSLSVQLGRIVEGKIVTCIHNFNSKIKYPWREYKLDEIHETTSEEVNHFIEDRHHFGRICPQQVSCGEVPPDIAGNMESLT